MFTVNQQKKWGKLYIVATPLGNLEDITLRAKNVLSSVTWIACEDTRHSVRLLNAIEVQNKLIALHAHNENDAGVLEKLIARLKQGDSGAIISDAGTPLISDPGLPLVRMAHLEGIQVIPIPGASALIAALSAMGIGCDRFTFFGFLPVKSIQRQKMLQGMSKSTETLVFYEAPHRVEEVISEMANIFGAARVGGIAREITKLYEQIVVKPLGELEADIQNKTIPLQGEFVLVVSGNKLKPQEVIQEQQTLSIDLDQLLGALIPETSLKKAVNIVKHITGLPKNLLYDRAVNLGQGPAAEDEEE
jgi:16S rRNA (cytidine1402-2'-O)-methyltransferase